MLAHPVAIGAGLARVCVLAACAQVLASFAAPFLAHGAAPAVGIGPFTIGMSMDEVRAAAPDLRWEDVHEEFSTKVVGARAANAVQIGAWTFKATIRQGYYGSYAIELDGGAPAKDRKQCRQNATTLVGELEQRFGPFQPRESERVKATVGPASVQAHFNAQGVPMISVAPGTVMSSGSRDVKAGQASAISVLDGRFGPRTMDWSTARTPPEADAHYAFDVRGAYFDEPGADGGRCTASIALRYARPIPPRVLPASELKLEGGPSIAVKHQSLEGVALPAEGVRTSADCAISAVSGAALCTFENQLAPDVRRALLRRTNAMRFDVSSFDPADPAPLRTRLDFALLPSERLVLPQPGAKQSVPITAIGWRRFANRDELWRSYPQQALRDEIEADVEVTCDIQADLSMICPYASAAAMPGAAPLDAPNAAAFETNARAMIEQRFVPAPRLVDGQAAPGVRVIMAVQFRLAP